MNTPRPAGKIPRLPYPVARPSGGSSPALLLAGLIALVLLLPALAAHAVEITDRDGTRITFDQPFRRIISLYPAHTENLVELGLTAEIIGVSKGDNPPAVADRPRFSDADNAEKFIAAAPDLLLVRPMISRAHPQLLARLRQSGITVVSLQPTGIEEMFAYWQTLGRLTGRSEAADDMRKRFLAGVAAIQKNIPAIAAADRPGVYVESIHSKMKTFSPASMTIYAVEAAGGRNIAADARPRNNSNIAEYGKEQIIARAGEIDIFLSQTGRMNPVDSLTLKNETGFQLIKAFRENRVHLIAEELVSRPTLRLLTGIEQLHHLFYPQQGADNR
jgi:iron complex transport system substrate-binding protein